MAKNLENRSISFDGQLFEAMENARKAQYKSRSEFVQWCVETQLQHMTKGGKEVVPLSTLRGSVPYARAEKPKSKR